jgi:hypothetical protein
MAPRVLRSFLLSTMRTEKQLSSPQPSAAWKLCQWAARSLYSDPPDAVPPKAALQPRQAALPIEHEALSAISAHWTERAD